MTRVIPESRRERKKSAVRQRIIDTAMGLFGRHGFDQVTVDHIADVADLGKGTIYNYFPAKEDIVVAYLADKERQVQAKVTRLTASKGSLAAVLTEYVRFQARLKRPYHPFVRVFLAQLFQRTGPLLPHIVEMQDAIDENLRTLLTRLQRRGLLRTDIPMTELILVFKTVHLGLNALWAIEGPPFTASDRTMRQSIRLLCEGLEVRR